MSVAIKRKVLPILTGAVILLVTVTVVSSVAAVRKCRWLVTAVNDAAGVYDEELSRAIYKMADSSVVDRMEFHSRNIEYDSEKYGSVEDGEAHGTIKNTKYGASRVSCSGTRRMCFITIRVKRAESPTAVRFAVRRTFRADWSLL